MVIVRKKLAAKYSTAFHFFDGKPVSQIVYDHSYSHAVIQFKDMLPFIEKNDYLKRYYFLKSSFGRKEIE